MKIVYKNTKEESFYCNEKALTLSHGKRMARKICQRIGELDAAENPTHLPKNARFHEHQGKRKGLFSLDLIHPYRLIVRPDCMFQDISEIDCVEIFEVMNPHR